MREISTNKIKDVVRELALKANFELRIDILKALKASLAKERDKRARNILKSIIENAKLAKKKRLAICQDTGFVTVYLEIGREVSIAGLESLEEAVNGGILEAYKKGCLRKSVLNDPLLRKNTNTNTPCDVHVDMVEGDRIRIIVSAKGFGSENKCQIKMFTPSANLEDIKKFVVDVVKEAGPDACPPFILGIGIGGTFDKAAYLSKRALLRPIDRPNPKKHFKKLERELLYKINALGMGPMGLGGHTTAIAVNILDFPTHIAGLPVAVCVSCHATRSQEVVI